MWRIALVLLAACAAGLPAGSGPDAGPGPGDAPTGCIPFITFDPEAPVADPDTTVRAIANVHAGGTPTYTWTVTQQGSAVGFADAQPDGSQIAFATPTPGVVHVELSVSVPSMLCQLAEADLNVAATGDNASYRLRVTAPPAPPQERTLAFSAGTPAFAFGTFALDPGIAAHGAVKAGATGVPAYLRFIPHGRPDAIVEAFTDMTGAFANVRLLDEDHDVLVVPMVAGYAPRLVSGYQPATTLIAIDAGQTATGTVKQPSGAALANARVQLTIGGVPSTIATTTATGAFSLAYAPSSQSNAAIAIEVTPPAGSGLPRLSGSSTVTTLSPAAPIAVAYAAAIAPRDLAGLAITRGGAPLASPTVTIAGSIAAAGTAGGVVLAGDVRASAVASSGGIVPALRAPNAPLSAVISVAAADVAVVAIDLSAAPPASIAAPAPVGTHVALTGAGVSLNGATALAIPVGALALAGAQPLSAVADTSGGVVLPLATGGHYDVRLADPEGRGALVVLSDVTAATAPAAVALPAAVAVTGKVTQSGNANPVAGAAIQVLCKACDGIDRLRPLGEAASSASGEFLVAVPDLAP